MKGKTVAEMNREVRKLLRKSVTHTISSVQYRNKKTGALATQIPMMEMGDWERAEKPKPKKPSPSAPFSAHIQYSIDKENWRRLNRF